MKNIALKIIGIILVLMFGPLIFVLILWLNGQSPSTVGSGLVIYLDESVDKKFKDKWYYRFFSFVVHKADEPFVIDMIRFFLFDLPLSVIVYISLTIISVLWTSTIFRILFHIDLLPFFTLLHNML